MPIYEYLCMDCGKSSEILVTRSTDDILCTSCGSVNLKKQLSAHASSSGIEKSRMPGLGDTSCCGSSPDNAGCAGPGSCCGKG